MTAEERQQKRQGFVNILERAGLLYRVGDKVSDTLYELLTSYNDLLTALDRLEKERGEAKMLLEHAVTMVSAPLDRMIVDFLAASSPGRERE